jgi:prevent-host-death family protein
MQLIYSVTEEHMIYVEIAQIELDFEGYILKVESGQSFVITRDGTPIAMLTPYTDEKARIRD